jgi:hypothetical protein
MPTGGSELHQIGDIPFPGLLEFPSADVFVLIEAIEEETRNNDIRQFPSHLPF